MARERKEKMNAIEAAREEGRRQGILEVSENYHRAIARFFRSKYANPDEVPGVAEEHREIAKRHETYADEILGEVWLQDQPDAMATRHGSGRR